MKQPRPRRRPALTIQVAALFLISMLPVLLGVGWLNYEYARTTLETQLHLDTTARTDHVQQRLADVLLRELERLTLLTTATALQAPAPSPAGGVRGAQRAAYEQAAPTDPARLAYVDNVAGGVLKTFREQYPHRVVALVADPTGALEGVTTPLWPYWDLTQQPWWPDVKHQRTGARIITRPLNMPNLGTLLFLAVPILDAQQQPVGVVAVGLKFADLARPLLDEGTQSTTLLVAGDRTVLYAVPAWAAPAVPPDWQGAVTAQGPGAFLQGPRLVGYAPFYIAAGYALDDAGGIQALNALNWTVVRVTDNATAPLEQQLTLLAGGTAVTAVVVVLLAVVGVRVLVTRPLGRLEVVIGHVQHQGLVAAATAQTLALLPRSRNEIGRLAQHFGQMLHDLTDLTTEREAIFVQQQAIVCDLRTTATQLQGAASEQQVIITDTNRVLEHVLRAFADLDRAALTIAEYARQIADQAAELHSQHEAGESAVAATQGVLGALQQTAQALETGAQILALDAGAAGQLIGQANEVADTTHLLSLNALIEAAGAGQYGARFGVIAAEVRQLAAGAAVAAGEIEQALARMESQTQGTAVASRQARVAIDQGAAQVQVLSTMMLTLHQSAERLAESASQIRQQSEDQRGYSGEVHVSSDQLANAMQQVTSASEQVAVQAHKLLQLANILDPETRRPMVAL